MFKILKKAVSRMIERNMQHPQARGFMFNIPRTNFDYAKEVGTGLGSNVIMAPVQWIMRTFPEAPVMIKKIDNKGSSKKERLQDHALLGLINKPNPFYTGEILWMATLLSWSIQGNAYWLKMRNEQKKVVELWYAPHWMMTPMGHPTDRTIFIDHYKYNPGGGMPIKLLPEDVVHFRFGLDPENVRQGLSQLNCVIREVFTDDEAANFSASLLRNAGVPSIVISPENEGMNIRDEDVKEIKEKFRHSFTGDKRGDALVMSGPTKVDQFGFNPQEMELGGIRDISEERVCAALGIPPAVVGFGAGLQTAKVGATMIQLIRLAWTGNIVPSQRILKGVLQNQLLIDFEPNPERFEVGFDNSEVQALQEDRDKLAKRLDIGVKGGWIRVSEAREQTGLEVEENDKVYLRPLNVIETKNYPGFPRDPGLVQDGEGGWRFKTALEERLAETADRKRPSRAQFRLAREFEIDIEKFLKRFRAEVLKELEAFGEELETIALEVLQPKAAPASLISKKSAGGDYKAGPEDIIDAEMIMSEISFSSREAFLKNVYKNNYTRIMKATVKRVNAVMDLAISIPEPREAEIIAAGSKRMELLKLRQSTKKRLIRELARGREEGEAVAQLARRIRDFVPSGRWSSPKVRANIIARMETVQAQRMAAAETYKEGGVTHVLILDSRKGSFDDDCDALDGTVVTLQEGEALMDDEHPNGTRRMIAEPPPVAVESS